MTTRMRSALMGATALAFAFPVFADDFVLYNGTILTMDEAQPRATAVAVSDGRIVAVGADDQARAAVAEGARRIDLHGRTVIPGLVDTHIHALRAGQSYLFETYWNDQTSLAAALGQLGEAAAARKPGEWAAVSGSWTPEQFDEKRAPTVADLDAAVPDRPAYVQYLYDYALVNAKGAEALGLNDPKPAIPEKINVERDADGKATGRLLGDVVSFNELFATIAPSDKAFQQHSTKAYFAELNRRGLTGIIDPSGVPDKNVQTVMALADAGTLTLRVGYRISAADPGSEPAFFEKTLAATPPQREDGMVRFLGLGESLVAAVNDGVRMGPGFSPPQDARDRLRQVLEFAAENKLPIEQHIYTDDAAKVVLAEIEAVAKDHPVADLGWSLAHLNTGSEETLDRMKALGLAYTVQMGPFYEGPAIAEASGDDAAAHAPPVRAALDRGILVAGGTDATRIGESGVWEAIEYHVTGASNGDAIRKAEDQRLTREEALRNYTLNAALLTGEADQRGTITAGKRADLAVLDRAYLEMPEDEIDAITADLTMLDGRIVHEAQP